MKLLTPLILLLFLACSNAPEQVIVEHPEPITHSKADSLKVQIFAEISRASKDSALMEKNTMLDTLLKYVDIYKDSTDKLEEVKRSLLRIHNKNTIVIDSMRLVKAENAIVKMENKKIKQMYALSNVEVHSAKEEAANLKKKFGTPTVAGVTVECFGFKTRFLKAPLQFKTDVAKDIKRIVIKFIIPANEIIEKKTYVFSIKISGILNKSVILKLTGEEMPVEPITFDIIDIVTPGDHVVTIECNGKKEYSGTLNFK